MPIDVSRRGFLATSGASALCAAAAAPAEASGIELTMPPRVEAMLVDGLANPLGIHNQRNRLSWQVIDERKGARQVAYRVGIASSTARAAAGIFDLWDSGRVESGQCFDIPYAGQPLTSRQRAWWTVTVWTGAATPITSPVAFWEMGLLTPADWQGDWVAAEDALTRSDRNAGFPWLAGPAAGGAQAYRLAFDLPEPATVTIFIAMSAAARLSLNGRAVALPEPNPNAWAPIPPVRLDLPLPAGRHLLVLAVSAQKEPDEHGTRAAMLVRASWPDGRLLYFGAAQVETSGHPLDDLAQASTPVDIWTKAVASDKVAPFPPGPAWLLRRDFTVTGAVAAARLYTTALGLYEAELNGSRIGDALLTPEFTDYRKRALYRVNDVTSTLGQGENVLGAWLGEGWYGGTVAPGGRLSFGPAPLRFMAQLEIVYTDGRRQIVCSDDQWQIAPAPITLAGIYSGEDYDARLEQPGWSAPGFKTTRPRWEQAERAPTPPCHLSGAVAQPIRRVARLAPKTVTSLGSDRYVLDFGQNFAGWVRARVQGRSGQTVSLRFAELLNKDGSIDQSNLRGARAADIYTLRGDPAGETYEPRFTYHGFRYVEIAGLGTTPRPEDFTGIVIHSDLAETGELTLGSYIPQRLWQNGVWSQRSNFMGIPTDCPQRDERLGWMGDAHVFWDAAAYNMDVAAFTARFMGDVEDAQHSDGGYADFAPDASGGQSPDTGSSPGWSDAGVALPWTVWWRYGDTAIIDTHWASMERYMASILAGNPDLIWSHGRGNDYADWLALDAKHPGDPTTPKDLVGTAMWKASADAMADMAAATRRDADAQRYRALARDMAQAFGQRFVGPGGTVGNGSQTGYIQALRFGLLPPDLRAAAAGHLVADIHRRGVLLSTGFLGTPYCLDVLADAGESQLLHDLLLRTAYPSWGYMIAHEATTIWERWNGDGGDRSMNSFNHYALGAVAGFMYRRIAGIDATAPGFSQFRFDPVYDPRMRTGGGRYASRSGLITTCWEWDDRAGFTLDLQVPASTRAEVVLPAATISGIRGGNRLLPAALRQGRQAAPNRITLELPAGRYSFHVPEARI